MIDDPDLPLPHRTLAPESGARPDHVRPVGLVASSAGGRTLNGGRLE
jgi:hypothetical protein